MSPTPRPVSTVRRPPADVEAPLRFVAWHDPIVETHPESHPAASGDTLVWFTPFLGPTATLMLHRLGGLVAHGAEPTFTLAELAQTFGMGRATGRVRTALVRLERFGLVAVNGHTVAVRTTLAPLTAGQRRQLPDYLAALYDQRRTQLRHTTGSARRPA